MPNIDPIRTIRRWLKRAMPDRREDNDYQARIAQEQEIFANQTQVHDLPEIFHYWSNKHLLPLEQAFGFDHPEDFLAKSLLQIARDAGLDDARFVSLGAGNCDAETRIARQLRDAGLERFRIECIDINPNMLERGAQHAADAGLGDFVVPVQGDFNRWRPTGRYDGVVANQSLHHVLELEDLFDQVHAVLEPHGRFVVSDMIGRNGHQRWPEALEIVQEFWQQMPSAYRYNLQLRRMEDSFQNWDCSKEGFEGIRAQDILPLLLPRFGFHLFFAYGNIIDPFIDRSFGHHFSPERESDTQFIDRIHARDELEMQAGRITPTHMMAVMSRDRAAPCRHREGLAPAACVRRA